MKIIISPTKTMKREKHVEKTSTALFLEESNYLRGILKTYDKNKLQQVFKLSDNLTNKVYAFFQNPQSKIQAINLYKGMAFKNMQLQTWDSSDFDFAQENLLILSAMYGALRPYDLICEYRLDYIVKFEEDLYRYWEKPLETLFKTEDLIINLASLEFSKGISHDRLINLHFLDEKGRNLSTQAKLARGNMLKYMVKNKITDPEKLKTYTGLDYKFIEEDSNDNNYYFSKK